MAATSKSPKKILLVGYLIGKLALPNYAHKFSPKTYTQPQLFACLVLKEFLHRDYRGIEQLLEDTPELAAAIELQDIPDHSTLQKAAKRLLRAEFTSSLLDITVRLGKYLKKLEPTVPLAAMDRTGLESRHAVPNARREKSGVEAAAAKRKGQHAERILRLLQSQLVVAVAAEQGHAQRGQRLLIAKTEV